MRSTRSLAIVAAAAMIGAGVMGGPMLSAGGPLPRLPKVRKPVQRKAAPYKAKVDTGSAGPIDPKYMHSAARRRLLERKA